MTFLRRVYMIMVSMDKPFLYALLITSVSEPYRHHRDREYLR